MKKVAFVVATMLAALSLVPASYAEPPARPACHDGIDNDGDGAVDHPADTDCVDKKDTSEETIPDPEPGPCADGVDNDGDGKVDHPDDDGCTDPKDPSEEPLTEPAPPACADGVDNDADGLTDYPADTDCAGAEDVSEDPPPPCQTVEGVTACMDYAVGSVVGTYSAAVPMSSLVHVAGFVQVYSFDLPNGGTVNVSCVVLGVGSDAVNPCKSAGGTLQRRVLTLVNDNVDVADSSLRSPFATVRVCDATLVMTVDDVGVDRFPAYSAC